MEPGTLRAYQDALRVPREQLGHRKLQSIGTADVNAVVGFVLTKGRKKGGPAGTGLGPRSGDLEAARDAIAGLLGA